MNRCVAFAGPGTIGKPAGPVPLMSKRSTTATYFDSQGIMRTAPPYELRPKYIYKNGVWVLDGWLREGASNNILTDISVDTADTNHVILPAGNEYEMSSASEVVKWTPPAANSSLAFCKFTNPSYKTTQSFFVKVLGGSQKLTLSRPWYWGPSVTVDTGTGEVTGVTLGMQVERYGDWWRMGGWGIVANQAAPFVVLVAGNDTPVLITCNMLEPCSANAGGNYWPSSWIPYGQTRAAD